MKKFSKILALVLAVTMVVSLGITAFADGEYTVTYDANGGDAAPDADKGSAIDGEPVQLPKTAGTYSGKILTEWNTVADGTGISYALGADYYPTEDITLYAIWADAVTVTYDKGEGAVGTVPNPETVAEGSTITLAAGTGLQKDATPFSGWNDGTNNYAAGESYTVNSDVTMIAQYTQYTITYDTNGGSGSAEAQSVNPGESVTLHDAVSKDGFKFVGWSDGAKTYDASVSYMPTADTTMTAQWAAQHTVTYDGNGNTDGSVPGDQTVTEGESFTVAAPDEDFAKTDTDFIGWNAKADGSGDSYAPGSTANAPTIDLTLYAQWADYSITVNNVSDTISIIGKTYSAYKLFDVTYSGDAHSYTIDDSNPFYISSKTILDKYFDFTKTSTDPHKLVVTVKDSVTFDSAAARALADALQANLPDKADATATAGSESVVIAVTDPGYYLVYGTAAPTDGTTDDVTAALALDTTDPHASVNVKAEVPSLEKEITGTSNDDSEVSNDGNEKSTSVNVGDKISYKLTSNVPNMNGYDSYNFIVTDTMSSGLTFNEDVVIKAKLGDVVITFGKDSATGTTMVGGPDDAAVTENVYYTVKTSGSTVIEIKFENFIQLENYTGAEITIEYSATLNEKALSTDKETTAAKLTYSNNPYSDTTSTTPEDNTYVYDFDIVVDKYTTSGESSANLEGAEFILYKLKDDEKYYYHVDSEGNVTWNKTSTDAYTAKTAADGSAFFKGIEEGTYYLQETKAPEGYNLLTSDIEVTITVVYGEEGSNPTFNSNFKMYDQGTYVNTTGKTISLSNEKTIAVSVENKTGTELPSTGGIGTTIFYVLGGILVVGAGVVLVTKRRMGKDS